MTTRCWLVGILFRGCVYMCTLRKQTCMCWFIMTEEKEEGRQVLQGLLTLQVHPGNDALSGERRVMSGWITFVCTFSIHSLKPFLPLHTPWCTCASYFAYLANNLDEGGHHGNPSDYVYVWNLKKCFKQQGIHNSASFSIAIWRWWWWWRWRCNFVIDESAKRNQIPIEKRVTDCDSRLGSYFIFILFSPHEWRDLCLVGRPCYPSSFCAMFRMSRAFLRMCKPTSDGRRRRKRSHGWEIDEREGSSSGKERPSWLHTVLFHIYSSVAENEGTTTSLLLMRSMWRGR